MALSAFGDKAAPPSPAALTRTLGSTSALWKDALRQISSGIGKTSTAWGFSGKSTGWGLRVKHGERVIVYLTPCEGHFMASFALGGAAVDEVRAAKLPDHIVEALATARRYAEGTGLRFKVSRAADVRALAKIAVIKATFLFLLFAFPGIALA